MRDHADDQDSADDPERTAVGQDRLTERTQVVGVFVEGHTALEDLEVAVHVSQQKADQD
jgi:hypothetical protein